MLNGYPDLWKSKLIWLDITAESLIALFYYAISILLLYWVTQRRNWSYVGILMILGVLTVAGGTTRLIDLWTLGHPSSSYWLGAGIEVITATIWLLTVLLLPKVLAQPRRENPVSDRKTLAPSGSVPLAKLDAVVSTLPSEAYRLHPTPTIQRQAEIEQRFNEQTATLARDTEPLRNELNRRSRFSFESATQPSQVSHLLQSLTQAINEASDVDSALNVVLRQVCELTNWDYGEAWLPCSDNSRLNCSPAWYGDPITLYQFRQTREILTFPPNTGLPGRVWTSQQPQWIEDNSAQPDTALIPPQAEAAGRREFGVPILVSEQVFAVLTFFIAQSRTVDKPLVELLTTILMQLGLVLQRKQLEEELRQEKDFTKTLIETSSAFFVAINAQGKTIMMNQSFLKALGYTLPEVLGADYLSTFVREADREALSQIFKQLVRLKQPILQENYVLTKEGQELLVEWRGSPIFNNSGKLDFFFGIGIDITERKQLEEELRKSEERYRAIVDDQTELICRFFSDGTLTFVNDAYCRYFGKTSQELLGSSLFQLIPYEYQEKTQKYLAALSLKGTVATREYQVVTPNGKIHWQQWTDRVIVGQERYPAVLHRTEEEHLPLVEFQSVGRDITERRQIEQQSARLASFPLLTPNPIVETDLDGYVRYLNPEAMRVLPDLQDLGVQHPFLAGVPSIATVLQHEGSFKREVKIGEAYYEQVLHYIDEIDCLRIYAFDITDRKLAEERLIHNAFYDQLTGLANRALFMDRLRQAMRRAKESTEGNVSSQPYLLAVLFLNLNRFKLVNNSLGNQVGDQLLQNFASRLQTCLRPTDTVARLGGDEFGILLEGIQDVSDATRVAESIDKTLSAPFYLDETEVFMTLSIGIALNTSNNDSKVNSEGDTAMLKQTDYRLLQPEDLLRDAGIAMYRAKAQGKSCYEVFDAAMHRCALERLQIETDLRRAIERQEFRVHYQPIVSLSTGKIIGFEALVRWQHPQRGLVSPTEFIPTAEETGLITPIGWWTLREACRQLKIWQEQFPAAQPLTINVNLSGKQFVQPALLDEIDKILQETNLVTGSLKLEITESLVMENPDLVRDLLLELKRRNIHLCIDDFGTGYSSLSRLHHFPISTLKIDRSFVSRIGALGENSEIVQAIVTLAQTLSMDVVAEGIELLEQVSPLIALQCEYGQGYFFSKPVDSEAARAMLIAESHQRGWQLESGEDSD
ncbi:MAG: EAL domain-containing protein [Symplocastrum torsivum CPER-KK1]|jgi:diguanylate cyclase (GGDEF)-like protein/PAS domain S-box-containing protein|uniref:EAL domain-containing protein n=1 Tax=Symplocastrum torsivum CPER-KK1 TaxID=450513 RepID=A0A951UC38_9CYAN|nr:EAL domain-containing protein [Symplocastrum torsivum CPER-KK1]